MTATDPIRLPGKRPHHGGSGHPAYTTAELEELLRLRRQELSFAAIADAIGRRSKASVWTAFETWIEPWLWTAELEAEARRRFEAGEPPQAIAAALGCGFGRAAIRKKALACGWQKPSTPCGQRPNSGNGSMGYATEMISVADADADADAAARPARRGPDPGGAAALPVLRALPPAPPAGRCQWPEGDVVRGDFHYCGARTGGAGSYCAAHAARARREPTVWEERQLDIAAKLLAGSKGR